MAAMNAVCEVFPGTRLDGCFFHFAQANWRHLNSSELGPRYRAEPEFALKCRMFTAMAFLPADRVTSAFDELKEYAPETEPLWSYFESTYIGQFEVIGKPVLSTDLHVHIFNLSRCL